MKKTKQKMTDQIRQLIAGFAGQEFHKSQILESIPALKQVNLDNFFTGLVASSVVVCVRRDGIFYYRQIGELFQRKPRRKVHVVTRAFDQIRDCVNGLNGQAFNFSQLVKKTGLAESVVGRFLLLGVRRKHLVRFGTPKRYQYMVVTGKLCATREPRGAVCEIVYEIMSKHPEGLSYEDVLSKAKNHCQRELNKATVSAIIRRWHSSGYARRISFGVYALRPHVHTRPPTKIGPRVIM